jgi:hypothetical protein
MARTGADLAQGREAYEEGGWAEAYRSLAAADAVRDLGALEAPTTPACNQVRR